MERVVKPVAEQGASSLQPREHGSLRRMRLRYGFNEINGWYAMSLGPHAEQIRARLRLMDTHAIRMFVFDQPVPSPVKEWGYFQAHLQAILDCGARPMITFAKFAPPYDRDFNIRRFVERCRDVVWGCKEVWGGDVVSNWYWCIWNEPNNPIVGGDLSFAQYKTIYLEVASTILDLLGPYLKGRKALIGGPSIDGTHRPYWIDWVLRMTTDFDDRMVGFVNWHSYGDWRPAVPSSTLALEMWNSPDPPLGRDFESILMAQTPTYEARARGVARLLQGRDILNVCGELNTISHHENYYTLGMNQNLLGAAYYASALIHLIRGGADLEMRWTATGHDDAYELLSRSGIPTVAGLGKQLFAQHVRYGDYIRFPQSRVPVADIDAILTWDDAGRRSCVFVNTGHRTATLDARDWDADLAGCDAIFKLDGGTNGQIATLPFEGKVIMDGYGIAVVTNSARETTIV